MAAKPTRYPAQIIFFPAAILHALIVVPLSVLTNLGMTMAWPSLAGSGHAHEMLGGFALALVAGYTLGNQPILKLGILFFLWLLGRLALLSVSADIAAYATLAFGIVLAAEVIPRFFPAKRWRNRSLLPLLAVISLLPGVWSIVNHLDQSTPDFNRLIESAGIFFLTLLMLFMGGRLIAPAAAGSFYQQGSNLETRVQPRIEGGLIILLPLAISLFVLGWQLLAGLLLMVVAALAFIRLWRWQLWKCKDRADLYGLGVGYAWLAVGLLVAGIALCRGTFYPALLHVITIGALGTLSTGVMARWFFHQNNRRLPSQFYIMMTVPAITLAVLARLSALLWPEWHSALLWVTVACWEVAYLAALVQVIRYVFSLDDFGGHPSA